MEAVLDVTLPLAEAYLEAVTIALRIAETEHEYARLRGAIDRAYRRRTGQAVPDALRLRAGLLRPPEPWGVAP
jgi:hypothetical protein